MPSDDVKSTAMTLRFKHGKHTVLLFAEPLTPFPIIIKELLDALHERYPSGLPRTDAPKNDAIPESGIDVVLGVPKDAFDMEKGWEELAISGAGLKETPKSLGLKDGAQIAFAFTDSASWAKDGKFHVEFSNVEELYPDEAEE